MPTSGMPSRSRLLMVGDPRLEAFARASRSRKVMALSAGDPFLGGIVRAIGGGIKFLGQKVVKPLIQSQLGISTPIPALPAPSSGSGPFMEGPVSTGVKKALQKFIPPQHPIPTFPVTVTRRRRRMNPLNPRALRRALSRASAFSRFARRALRITFGKAPKVRFKLGRGKRT